MTTISIYDCCDTGMCGTGADPSFVTFTVDVAWVRRHGAKIECFNLVRQPAVFSESEIVRNFLNQSGAESLPLALVNGEVVLAGRYPKRTELARWAGITPQHRLSACCCCGQSC